MNETATLTTTGTVNGHRVYTKRAFEHVNRAELDFIPAHGDRPAQARIRHRVWVPRLHRYDMHVSLVVQDDAFYTLLDEANWSILR